MSGPNPDDLVADDEPLLRRIPHFNGHAFVCMDDESGETRLSSGSFAPDEDGVSVYRTHVLRTLNLGPDCLIRSPLNGVAELAARAVRAEELDVKPDPNPKNTGEPEHPRDAAHALIIGLGELSKSRRRKAQRALAAAATIIIQSPQS